MKNSKKNRQRSDVEKCAHEKSLPALTGKTQRQKEALQALQDPNVPVVILAGPAGVGKSYLPAAVAADAFRENKISRIIVARPYVQTGKTSGFKPGSSLEKLYPYVRNVLDTIQHRLGRGVFDNHLKDGLRGEIEVQELESIRGRSFMEPSFLIVDEAQQSTPEEMESIITRVGEGCKLVLTGDTAQKDVKGESGLEWVMDFFKRHGLSDNDVAHIKFGMEDCVRSGFVRKVLEGIEDDKNKGLHFK